MNRGPSFRESALTILATLAVIVLLAPAASRMFAQSQFVGPGGTVKLLDAFGANIGPAVSGSLPIFCSNCSTGITNWGAGLLQKGGTAAMTGTTSTQVIAAVASNYLYISSCSVNNIHASNDTLIDLQDGSGGTTIWTFTAAHNYGGESHTFTTPLKVPTVGNALFAANETTTVSTKVFCQGFSSTTSY